MFSYVRVLSLMCVCVCADAEIHPHSVTLSDRPIHLVRFYLKLIKLQKL